MKTRHMTLTSPQAATLGMVLIFGCVAILGVVVSLSPWVSAVVGWGLCLSIVLSLTAYAFERRVA